MALEISGASIGYNQKGLGDCLLAIHTEVIGSAITAMNDSYETFCQQVDSCWVGNSADTFKKNFEKNQERIEDGLKAAEEALETQFDLIMYELAHADSELIESE